MKNISKIAVLMLTVFFYTGKVFAQAEIQHVFGATAKMELPTTSEQKMNCTAEQVANRTFDGSCNNLTQTDLGAVGTLLNRRSPAVYADGDCGLEDRGNPREISNTVFAQTMSVPDSRGLSSYAYTWLQFIDHDISLSPEGEEEANIRVPIGDPFFDPNSTDTQEIPFHRSLIQGSQCEQTTAISHWVDGSMVYGSDESRANWLRTFSEGKLKTSPSLNGDLLPCNTIGGNCNNAIDPAAPSMAGDTDSQSGTANKVFVAGDIRANEQPSLTAMHTLFVREHNRICDLLLIKGLTNDEMIYRRARKIVGAQIQAITYNEILPCMGIFPNQYNGYDDTLDPSILSEFSTAAFRLGHTMVPATILLRDQLCREVLVDVTCDPNGVAGRCPATYDGEISLRDGFFNPSIIANSGIEPILVGLSTQNQQAVDRFVIDDLRNFLFGAPGQGGLDLVSLNIQRGRDHGLPDYNTVRQSFNLAPVEDFSGISSDPATIAALSDAYADIDNIDAWVGMLAENTTVVSSVGETLNAILKKQFEMLRDADRLWFQIDPSFTAGDRTQLWNTRLDDIIRRNTSVKNLDNLAFATACPESYCIPDYSDIENHCYTYISEVTLADISNTTTATTAMGAGYNDFTDKSTKVMAGETYELTVQLGSCTSSSTDTRFNVWVDWNADGSFNEQEEHLTDQQIWYNTSETLVVTVDVPEDAQPGPIRLRIRSDFHATTTYEACSPYSSYYNNAHYPNVGGETEDYTLVICDDYCIPAYTEYNCNGYISGFELVDIINRPTNEGAYANSYQIYDLPRTSLTQGETYTATIDLATCIKDIALSPDLDLALWVDWNGNGLFEADESLYDSNNAAPEFEWVVFGEPNTITISVPVPEDAPLGLTKVRVRVVNSTTTMPVDPCDEYLFGETEDYCIIIIPAVCDPSYETPGCDSYIQSISLGDYSNSTDESLNTGGYSTYLDTCVNLQAGENHQLTVQLTTCEPGSDPDLGVWVDFNQDGIFDTDELLYDSNTDTQDGYEWFAQNQLYEIVIDFELPASTPLGKTRLRVRTNTLGVDTETIDPCLEYASGEAEDYYVNIIECKTIIAEILGDSIVMSGDTSVYTIPETDPDATYEWIFPQGANIVSGQGSNSVSVVWGMAGGQVTVIKTVPNCGTANAYLAVTIETVDDPCMTISDVYGVYGEVVDMPVTVANFTQVNGFQFSLDWDPTVAKYVGAEDFALTGTPVLNPSTVGHFSIVWSDIDNPATVADGTVLITLQFELLGDADSNTKVTLGNNPIPEFTMGLPPVPNPNVCVNFGNMIVEENLRVSGAVCTPIGGQILPQTTDVMVYNMDQSSQKAVNPNPINYAIDKLEDGDDYMLSPFNNSPTSNCTVTDIVFTQYMIVDILPFSSPYQYIAADVDGSGSVSITDVIYMQYYITGLLPNFPNGTYTYICTDSPPTLAAPFNFKQSYVLDDLGNSHFGLDYVGVELGDVNGAASQVIPTLRTESVTLATADLEAASGTTIRLPITASNFEAINGLQFSLEWESDVLEYVGYHNGAAIPLQDNNFNFTQEEQGKLGLVWHDASLNGLSLDDGETLFDLEFKVIGKAGDRSSVSINSALIPTEIINTDLANIPLAAEQGSVSVSALTSIENIGITTGLQVVPNPLSKFATIQLERPYAGKVSLEIFNSLGQSVWNRQVVLDKGFQEIELDATRFPNGIYFLQVKGERDTDHIELIISK